MNDIQIFSNTQFGNIRTTVKDGEPLFVAADVCRALEITNVGNALARLDGDEKDDIRSTDTIGRTQEVAAVTESGLYSLVLGSRKPEAKAFKRWITHDVLPTIRKTGGYVNETNRFVDYYFPDLRTDQKNIIGMMLDESKRMGDQLKEQAPKVLFADAVTSSHTSVLVSELAKLIRQNGVDIGQKRLFTWMRENGYLLKRGSEYNMPSQSAMEMGLFEIKETAIAHADGHTTISKTPKVTGKGQSYFVNKFLGKGGKDNAPNSL